eukprot:COSAG02_NODE_7298_length_3077_cov_81.755876_1_plen_85_part_10
MLSDSGRYMDPFFVKTDPCSEPRALTVWSGSLGGGIHAPRNHHAICRSVHGPRVLNEAALERTSSQYTAVPAVLVYADRRGAGAL